MVNVIGAPVLGASLAAFLVCAVLSITPGDEKVPGALLAAKSAVEDELADDWVNTEESISRCVEDLEAKSLDEIDVSETDVSVVVILVALLERTEV